MIVNRRTFIVKKGQMDRVVELLREVAKIFPHPHPRRMYRPNIAPFDQFILDVEHESMDEYHDYWERARAMPEFEVFMNNWNEATEPGGTNEIWEVETV